MKSPFLSTRRLNSKGTSRAFTLIELLTVIAIIGILAAIIIPVVGKVRKTALGARCISNLRSIGVAMSLYADDNKGFLPGGLKGGQGIPSDRTGFTKYISGDSSLGTFLYSYLTLPEPKNTATYTDILICPVFAREITSTSAPSYIIPDYINDKDGSLCGDHNTQPFPKPFGYQGNGITASFKNRPKSIAEVYGRPIGPSRLWAVADCDRQIPGTLEQAGWKELIPQKPIHGNYRNALFFDWHVGKILSDGSVH